MTTLNLLPWRQQRRAQEKKWFITLVALGIVVAAFIIFLINSYVSHLGTVQAIRNENLRKEILYLDDEIKEIKFLKQNREIILSRMLIIQNLQNSKILMVHLFDELIKVMPLGVYATKLEKQKAVVSLEGLAESHSNISLLMVNIDHDAWIHDPILTEIKKMNNNKQHAKNKFKLNFVLSLDFGQNCMQKNACNSVQINSDPNNF